MSEKRNTKKVLLVIIIVPILLYLAWVLYLKINTETIFDIVGQVLENKAVEKIEVSSIYSQDVKFSIEDKQDIDSVLDIMKTVEVVNTEYKTAYNGKKLYNDFAFCCGDSKIIMKNYTYPDIHISAINAKSSSLPKNSNYQVKNFTEQDMLALEAIINKYN